MKNLLKYSLVLVLTLGLSVAAHAGPLLPPPPPPPPSLHPHTAPEFDATLAAGGLALVGGMVAVLRARRRK